ncbi:MAG: TonB family protein [Pseudomonadota bacterium]
MMRDERIKRYSNFLSEMRWSPMVVVSFLFHFAVFSIILFIPDSFPTRSFEGVVYEVNLVEMPAGGDLKVHTPSPAKGETKGAPVVKKDTQAKRISAVEKEKKPLVISKRTIEKKIEPVKKPQISPSELIDKAISKIETKVKAEEKSPIERAISKLETKAREEGGTGPGGGQGGTGIAIRIYQAEVEERIKSNWSYPVALEGKEDLEAIVGVMVKRDGAISNIEVKKRSGSVIFDQSVLRAVERSDPLPPFPEGYIRSYDDIEIRFNLRELQAR